VRVAARERAGEPRDRAGEGIRRRVDEQRSRGQHWPAGIRETAAAAQRTGEQRNCQRKKKGGKGRQGLVC
jgi:hypothetical protein